MAKNNKQKESFFAKNKWLTGAVIIVLATYFIFSPAINYDFVNWDDDVNVLENPTIKKLDSEHIHAIFTNHVIGNYNPLSILSFAIEYHFVGESAKLYHFNNILLHIICTLLVFIIFRKLGVSFFVSFVAALLFGIHPMRIESVVWITERKDVLFGAFYLGSIVFYIDFVKKKKNYLFLLSIILFVLSLLSKIQAVSLPLSLLLIDYWFKRKLNKKLVFEKVPFFALSLVTGLVGIYFLGKQESLDVGNLYPIYQRIFVGSYSFMVYLIKSVFPYEMTTLYPMLKKLTAIYYISIIPVLLLVILPLFRIKNYRKLIFGLFFFVFNVVFMLQIVGAGQGFIADRFTYIPYIGLFFLYALGIEYLLNRFSSKKWMIMLPLVVYFIVLGSANAKQIKVWENSETLWTDVLSKYPKVPVAYNNLGRYYRINNQPQKALQNYNHAIQYNPEGAMAYNNRGKIYFDRGEIDRALADFNKCLELQPDLDDALANRGAAYGKKKQWQLALNDLNEALKINPRHLNALKNRGYVFFKTGEYQKNIDDYRKYLSVEPQNANIISTIGLCYYRLKEYEKSLAEYQKAIAINPSNATFYINRSITYNAMGKLSEALQDALKAQQLGYKVNANYLNYLKQNK